MSIPRLAAPPGQAQAYVIPAYEGETMEIPGSKSTIRILASARESEGLISVFHMDGFTGDAPGFHYHDEAHDIFMVTKGQMVVWAGDKCRVLGPGDFCSVPPKVIHQPQLLGPFNETIGLVTPGHWVDFFRFISEEYGGVLTNEFDARDIKKTLFPKFKEIKEKYDVVFQPQHKGCEIGDWTEDDSRIPESTETYYLRANTGPRYLLGGILSRPFITTKQSGGKFAITSIESSSRYAKSVLSRPFAFGKVHQVYCVLDGAISITVDGATANVVRSGETVFLPAGTNISVKFLDRYVRFWSFASGDGLETLVSEAGAAWEGVVVPEQERDVDEEKVAEVANRIGLIF